MKSKSVDIELDTGRHARQRERLCVATRTVRPLADLIRFVAGPQGEAVPDVKHKLPGRGVWVTATRAAVGAAVKHNALARGLRQQVRASLDLVSLTDQQLERAALEALAIAGKAGLALTGFAKVERALQHGEAVALIHAAEASPQGIRKLAAALRRPPGEGPVIITILSSVQLDLALGRPNVVHAALLAGPASGTFLARWRRLERFRTGDQDNQSNEAAPDWAERGHGRV
jgi:uncharacterized protein